MSNLNIPSKEGTMVGHQVFIEYSLEFRKFRSSFNPDIHDETFMQNKWDNFTKERYSSFNYQLKSYFKIFRVIFYTISISTAISDAEKKYYADVVRMLLTIEEQIVLMWISSFDRKLNQCCNKHGLLREHYNPSSTKIGVTFFKIMAFGNTSEWQKAFEENKQ